MKNFLRKILNIQTLKFVIVNPSAVESATLDFSGMPIHIIISYKVDDIKVIDTGIVVKRNKV